MNVCITQSSLFHEICQQSILGPFIQSNTDTHLFKAINPNSQGTRWAGKTSSFPLVNRSKRTQEKGRTEETVFSFVWIQ